jgi:hypothetical protein
MKSSLGKAEREATEERAKRQKSQGGGAKEVKGAGRECRRCGPQLEAPDFEVQDVVRLVASQNHVSI